jgi:predicted permease
MDPLTVASLTSKALGATKHAILRTLSVVCVLTVIAGIGWSVYVALIRPHTKPNPTTTQNANTINNTYYYPNKKVFSFGATVFGLDIGLVKYSYPDKPLIKQTEMENKK